MSGVMEEAERFWASGLSSVKETCVCANHFSDRYVKRHIKKNSELGYCNYCKKDKKVISLEDLMFYFMEILTEFYTDAAEFMSYDSGEGGYLGTVIDSYELFDELNLDVDNHELQQDMMDSIADKPWANPNQYYESDSDILMYSWNYFKEIVQHKARYLFYNTKAFKHDFYGFRAHTILKEVSKGVKKMRLLTVLNPNTIIYRCRQHDKETIIEYSSQIAAPDKEFAIYPNRMSPAGIAMFYGSLDLETAELEVVDSSDTKRKYLTSAVFKNKESLNLIDFTKVPTMNIFNEKLRKDYYLITFLHDFIKDLSKPIKHDGKVHIEYVPTQILTEFFRYIHPNHRISIDGIIYPSSKNKKGKAVVLFMNHKESLAKLNFQKESIKRTKINGKKN